MQIKALLFLAFGAIAMAAPSQDAIAREDLDLVNSGVLTAEDIQQCRDLEHRRDRRDCREDKYSCRERGRHCGRWERERNGW